VSRLGAWQGARGAICPLPSLRGPVESLVNLGPLEPSALRVCDVEQLGANSVDGRPKLRFDFPMSRRESTHVTIGHYR
jgi:hypothetical protein